MTLKDDLSAAVTSTFRSTWEIHDAYTVPEAEELQLTNYAKKLTATVLYADLAESTAMVQLFKPHVSAELYKAFLYCAARIIRSESGAVTAYDGDRIMGVFIDPSRTPQAVRAALKIHYAVAELVVPALHARYRDTSDYELKCACGIDASDLFVARTGARGANDLVWVGRAANYAAKLSTARGRWRTFITPEVFAELDNGTRYASDGADIWQELKWTEFDSSRIYGSTYYWTMA